MALDATLACLGWPLERRTSFVTLYWVAGTSLFTFSWPDRKNEKMWQGRGVDLTDQLSICDALVRAKSSDTASPPPDSSSGAPRCDGSCNSSRNEPSRSSDLTDSDLKLCGLPNEVLSRGVRGSLRRCSHTSWTSRWLW